MSCSCRVCGECIEIYLDELRDDLSEIEAELDFNFRDLEFSDDTCEAILNHDLDACIMTQATKRRRIIKDAQALAEAWQSAENLKKIFRKDELPKHFVAVCSFLG